MGITLSVLLAVVGAFLVLVPPFTGAQWLGGLLFLAGFYVAWRVGKRIRREREEWEKSDASRR